MSDELIEKISSLIDGEISPREETRLLKEIVKGNQLRQKWEHYQLIRDALKKEIIPVSEEILTQRIRQALSAEPMLTSPYRSKLKIFLVLLVLISGGVFIGKWLDAKYFQDVSRIISHATK